MRRNLATFLVLFLLAIDLVTLGFAVSVKNSQDDTLNSLRAGLISSCENNGNPLRVTVQNQLRTQLQQTSVKTFRQFGLTVTPAVVAQQKTQLRAEIKQIAPVNCQALYPN